MIPLSTPPPGRSRRHCPVKSTNRCVAAARSSLDGYDRARVWPRTRHAGPVALISGPYGICRASRPRLTMQAPDRGTVVDPRRPGRACRPPDAQAWILLPANRLLKWRPGSEPGVMGRKTHDAAVQASVPCWLRSSRDRAVPRVLRGRHADRSRRSDRRRVTRPRGHRQVRHLAAHSAGYAPVAHDPPAGRQAHRLLRDLDAPAVAADPANRFAADDGLGLRRGHERFQPRAPAPQRPVAHDRGAVEPAGPGQVDQRARGRGRELSAASSPG